MSAKDYFSAAELSAIWLMPQEPTVAYDHVSQGQLSIIRHYRGGTVNGARYEYITQHDLAVRQDVQKMVAAMRKLEAKRLRDEQRQAAKAAQGELL